MLKFDTSDRALALIKPDAYAYMGEILDQIQQAGFSLCRLRMIRFNQALAEQVLGHDYAKSPAFACVFFCCKTAQRNSHFIIQ